MEKILNLKIYEQENYGVIDHQEIMENISNEKINFSVFNLYDCPEDAIIGRDLFDGFDYINALNKGIQLAKLGYDKVVGQTADIKEIEDFN